MRWAALALLVLAGCGGSAAEPAATTFSPAEVRELAYDVCQQAVEMDLRAPATAEWPRFSEVEVLERLGRRFGVFAWVDAQNGFGALIRSDVHCELRRVGDSDRFTVLEVEIT